MTTLIARQSSLDAYVFDVLMPDLVGHDRRPARMTQAVFGSSREFLAHGSDNGARTSTTVTGRDGADEMLERASDSADVEWTRRGSAQQCSMNYINFVVPASFFVVPAKAGTQVRLTKTTAQTYSHPGP